MYKKKIILTLYFCVIFHLEKFVSICYTIITKNKKGIKNNV